MKKVLPSLVILTLTSLAVLQTPVSHAEDLTNYLPISSVTPGATNPAVIRAMFH